MKKLNIGCGNVPLIGYTNIDKYYFPGSNHIGSNFNDYKAWNIEHPKSPWMYGDAEKLEFNNEEFDEVIMVHCLEHLSMDAGSVAIKEAVRVLKKGGSLEIEVPDLVKACWLFLDSHITIGENNSSWFRVMGLLYGDQGGLGEGQFHLCGYSREYLKLRMEEHGLTDIEDVQVGIGHGTREGMGHPEPEYDFRLRGVKV
jgi:SAM-dependent methyltransferase